MKHFLVVFDRVKSSIVRFEEFTLAADALTARFEAEAEHASDRNIEVVVLGADSKDALRLTHSRYFQGTDEIAKRTLSALRGVEAGQNERLARLAPA